MNSAGCLWPVRRLETTMALPPSLEELLELGEMLDREQRIDLLMSLAARLPPPPARIAARPYPENRRVPGCESQVYVWAEPQPEGTFHFHFAVENPQGVTAQAWAFLLQEACSGASPEQIAAITPDLIFRVFGPDLSVAKIAGLTAVLQRVKDLAQAPGAGSRPEGSTR